VDRHAQAVDVTRAVDEAQRAADRGLRGQVGVRAAQERSARLAGIGGVAALAKLLETVVVGDVRRATGRHLRVVGRQPVDGVARIGVPVEGLADATVQVRYRRRAEAFGPG